MKQRHLALMLGMMAILIGSPRFSVAQDGEGQMEIMDENKGQPDAPPPQEDLPPMASPEAMEESPSSNQSDAEAPTPDETRQSEEARQLEEMNRGMAQGESGEAYADKFGLKEDDRQEAPFNN
ncbi:MAG: hypothetical protein HY282_07645 [Nitrospirae bacterium]|nr:hypothetical protein [Candidatus Manganitrophaceae bacterium]